LSFQTNIHLTSVYDPPAGTEYWYTNGVLVSQNTGVTVPMSYVDDVTNFICHSIYTTDPHEDINISEFRIYNGALTSAEVMASQVLGSSQVLSTTNPVLSATKSGANLVLSWPLAAAGFTLQWNPSLSGGVWTTVPAQIVGGKLQASVPITGSSGFFRLQR
jgi:hypothetical protein